MNEKQYNRLLDIIMEKMDQVESENTWLKFENKQLKDIVENSKKTKE